MVLDENHTYEHYKYLYSCQKERNSEDGIPSLNLIDKFHPLDNLIIIIIFLLNVTSLQHIIQNIIPICCLFQTTSMISMK